MSLSPQQRYDAAVARDEQPQQPRWPVCRRCSRPAKPGLACEATRCPWTRENGVLAPALLTGGPA